MASFLEKSQVNQHQKGKRFWILQKQKIPLSISGWQRHQLGHMQIRCISLWTDNHASTALLNITNGYNYIYQLRSIKTINIPLLWKHCAGRKLYRTRMKLHQSCIQGLCLHTHHRFYLLCFFVQTSSHRHPWQHHRHWRGCNNWMMMQKLVNEASYRHCHPSYTLHPSESLDHPPADPLWVSSVRMPKAKKQNKQHNQSWINYFLNVFQLQNTNYFSK